MGLLTQGQPLKWEEVKKYTKIVQDKGIRQFIRLYNGSRNRADGQFKWGDEIEYILLKYNDKDRIVQMNLAAEKMFHRLDQLEKSSKNALNAVWHPEFAAYMLESTPKIPYDCDSDLITGLCKVEDNMNERRRQVRQVLSPDESIMSMTNFPRHGCLRSSYPVHIPNPATSDIKSVFLPDEIVFAGHPRFKMIAKNIRARRGSKVAINLPLYMDIKTPNPYIENHPIMNSESRQAAKPNHVYMDTTGFGMGCCCLQITFQATHLKEAKNLYDQMIPLAPILTALSAATPACRGLLTERDCRWNIIEDACDDRTIEERGCSNQLMMDCDFKISKCTISKSRYASVSSYLTCPGQAFNDIALEYNEDYYNLMIANNIEHPIARHIAHLFIRDPLALYLEKIDQSDEDTDHFENIQSSNWQTLRFKPPPSIDSPIGWRVEFRPLEVQITDFENAAYSIFVILLSRIILVYKLNLLIPISLVDKNMLECQKRDAILESKFWFRTNIMKKSNLKPLCSTRINNNSGTKCYCTRSSSVSPVNNNNINNNINVNVNSNITNIINADNNVINLESSSSSTLQQSLAPKSQSNNRAMDNNTNGSSIFTNNFDNYRYTSNSYGNNNKGTTTTTPTTTSQSKKGQNQKIVSAIVAPDTKYEEYAREMTIDEIINGSEKFVGLINLVNHYVDSLNDGSNCEQIKQIKSYLRLISHRAKGKVKTTARFIRDFVRSHPHYEHDSVVNESINYDLISFLDKLSKGEVNCPELLGF